MHVNQSSKLNSSADLFTACLSAIETSMDHFARVRKHIKELAASLQEDETEPKLGIAKSQQTKNGEPLCISKINYIAVLSLEYLGISSPSQQQIDTMESIILLSMNPNELNREKLEIYMGNETIAKRILLRQLRRTHQ